MDQMKHSLHMEDRKDLKLSGVNSVVSFHEECAEFETALGFCQITGKDLHMDRLDLEAGEVELTGEIASIYYPPTQGEQKKGLLQKLFS